VAAPLILGLAPRRLLLRRVPCRLGKLDLSLLRLLCLPMKKSKDVSLRSLGGGKCGA